MIDFGKHALHIWLSYSVTGGLILGLVVQSILAARRTRAELEEIEDER